MSFVAYIDDKRIYPFSMTATLPPMDNSAHNIPAFLRIVTRGRADEVRSDIGSLELFSVSLWENSCETCLRLDSEVVTDSTHLVKNCVRIGQGVITMIICSSKII